LRTDDYGDETEVWLINAETQEFIWYDWGFDSNRSEQYNACLDANGCATFEIFDSWGDGISESGGITLTFGGEVVYEGGDFGSGGRSFVSAMDVSLACFNKFPAPMKIFPIKDHPKRIHGRINSYHVKHKYKSNDPC
jgi:hypothetical protein